MKQFSRILVTGGAGFIGSHVVEAFLRQGADVAIVDNLDSFYPVALKLGNLEEIAATGTIRNYQADIRHPEDLEAIFQAERPEMVIHLAALAGVRPSIMRPRDYAEVNVGGTLNLFELSRRFGVRKFLFASSSSVYGATAPVPFTENATGLKPISPYAATKLAGELLAYTYAHLYGLPIVCLRFFTVYGPRQRPDLAIRKFAELIDAGKPVPIYGDGTAGRDFTYVDDIVRGILAAADFETAFDVFNLGNSHAVTVLELVRLLEKTLGKRATLDFRPAQPGDVPLTWADISKTRQCLGYEPSVTLEEGLQRFQAWRSHAERRRAMAPQNGARRFRLRALTVKCESYANAGQAKEAGRPK
jgi:UDP-glucuronate 4-epimerase